MNRWGRMVLAAGPITNAPLADLNGTAVDLTMEILIEADDHEVDFVDATHRVLRKALGKRGFERARRAMFSAATWAADDLRICRRLALELFGYFSENELELASPDIVDAMMEWLLLTDAELEAKCKLTERQPVGGSATVNRPRSAPKGLRYN